MTALLIGYYLGYGTTLRKMIWAYASLVLFGTVALIFLSPSTTYAQSHTAAQSSISDDDWANAYTDDDDDVSDLATELLSGSSESSSGDTTTGATEEDEEESSDDESATDDEEEQTTSYYNDRDGSAVDALNDLLDLQQAYKSLDVFKGNNTEFYELLRDRLAGYTTAYQAEKFIDIVQKLKILDDATFEMYGLNRSGLMDVLPEMADEQESMLASDDEAGTTKKTKKKWESYNTDDLILTYELYYGVTKATAGVPLVFFMDAEGATNIKRATRRFGNDEMHTCKWSQCDRISRTYDEPGTYEIMVSFQYANGEKGLHIFEIKVGEKSSKKSHNAADERVIVDVMKGMKTVDSDDETTEANEEDTDDEEVNEEDLDETTEELLTADDEELDDAFESLLLSIFGE